MARVWGLSDHVPSQDVGVGNLIPIPVVFCPFFLPVCSERAMQIQWVSAKKIGSFTLEWGRKSRTGKHERSKSRK